jgi:hypothetical protein
MSGGKVGSQDVCLDRKGRASIFGGKSRVAKYQKVPKEEAAVKAIGALEDRYRDRHLAVDRRSWKADPPHRSCTEQGQRS